MNAPVPPKTNGDKIPVAKTHYAQLQREANKWRNSNNSNKRKNPNNEDNKVSHIGKIIFMGQIMPAYYCSNLDKSYISKPMLCNLFKFQINKISNYC